MTEDGKKTKDKTLISWKSLVFMAFATLWGFGNVTNGYFYFDGPKVIFSWILMFVLYFIPYAMIVGELGSKFKDQGGGVTSWIQGTNGSKLAYYAGWTYWAVHITYIASKASGGLKAVSWMIFKNAETYDSFKTIHIQLISLGVLLLFAFIASRGINPLKRMTSLAGSTMFVMGILYIILALAAPKLNPNHEYLKFDWKMANLVPDINLKYITSLSILVFAVGGVEKISPYINKMEGDSSKEFPKSMIFAAAMVVISALLGTVAMSRMFDPELINASPEAFDSYVANGAYWSFQKLGEYYGLGNLFLVLYALCNAIGQLSILVLSIDAPLRMLLEDDNTSQYIPRNLLKKNKYGAYTNGIKMVVILSGAILATQILLPSAASVLQQITKLNSVTMPLRYLWVFVAYYNMKKKEMDDGAFKFTKSKGAGMFWGAWCFILTLACCILGMYSENPVTFALNVATPIILVGLGLIFPVIRKKEDEKLAGTSK